MIKGILKTVDGIPVTVLLDEDKLLEQLQGLVGGYIECVNYPINPKYVIIADEEGLLKGKKPNIYHTYFNKICGNVVILKTDGESFASVEDSAIRLIKEDLINLEVNYIKEGK